MVKNPPSWNLAPTMMINTVGDFAFTDLQREACRGAFHSKRWLYGVPKLSINLIFIVIRTAIMHLVVLKSIGNDPG